MRHALFLVAVLLLAMPATAGERQYARTAAQATEDLRVVEGFLRHTGRTCLANPSGVRASGAGSVCRVADHTLSVMTRLKVPYGLKAYPCIVELRFDVRSRGIDYEHTVVSCTGTSMPEKVAEQVSGPDEIGRMLSVIAAYARTLVGMEGFGFA